MAINLKEVMQNLFAKFFRNLFFVFVFFLSTSDTPFTLIVPKIDVRTIEKSRLREFMLEHLVPGKVIDSYTDEDVYGNGNGHKIVFRKVVKSHNPIWLLNGFQILHKLRINENLFAITIEGYLGDRKSPYSKRNIPEPNR